MVKPKLFMGHEDGLTNEFLREEHQPIVTEHLPMRVKVVQVQDILHRQEVHGLEHFSGLLPWHEPRMRAC